MALPGSKILVCAHPTKRDSWDLNGETGWPAGPSMNHSRCVQCCMLRTRALIDANEVEFFLHSIPFASVTLKDFLEQAANDIVSLLTNPPKSAVPSLQAGDPACNAILNIAKILKRDDEFQITRTYLQPHFRGWRKINQKTHSLTIIESLIS